jgi:uncharacterized protein YdhG (YjbR/CyaY superfamily)
MDKTRTGFTSIDQYIASFPKDVQKILKAIRAEVKRSAPEAQEKISYQMPAFAQNGILVCFAAFKSHIGFYPTPSTVTAFKKDLAIYKQAKGSVQFPIDAPMPLKLIGKMVKYRVAENLKKSKVR